MVKSPSETLLAFDYGRRNVGAAVGRGEREPMPLLALSACDWRLEWRDIAALIEEWQPSRLLVGLPLRPDGSEGRMCFRARNFASWLAQRSQLPCELVDERLTTAAARIALARRQRQAAARTPLADSIAAVEILLAWQSR